MPSPGEISNPFSPPDEHGDRWGRGKEAEFNNLANSVVQKAMTIDAGKSKTEFSLILADKSV